MKYGHWNIELVGEFDPRKYIGFCYVVEFNDGTKYIGSKKLWKSIDFAPIDDVRAPTKWQFYKTSQKRTECKIDKNPNGVSLSILSLHKTYGETLAEENRLHKMHEVGTNPMFLNLKSASTKVSSKDIANISTLYWKDPEYRKKVRLTKITNIVIKYPERYSKYFDYVPTREEVELIELKRKERYARIAHKNSVAQKGRVFTPEHKANMAAARINKKPSPEGTYDKVSRSLKEFYRVNGRSSGHIEKSIANRRKDENGKYCPRRVKSLVVNGVDYKSFRDASIKTGLSVYNLKSMINSNPDRIVVIYK